MPTTNLPTANHFYGAPVNLIEGVDYEIEYNDAVNIPFWIETGSPFRNQERGEMSGYNAVKRRNAYSDFAVTTEARGLKVFETRVVPIPVLINTNPVVHTRVRSGSTTINMSLPSITHMGKSVIQKGYAQIGMSISVTASGTNATKSSSVSLSMSITQVVNGKNKILNAFAVLNSAISSSAEAEKVKMINAFAVLNCAISTSAEAEKGTVYEGESTVVLGITTEARGILNPLNLNWDALTDADDGMLYSVQESTNTLGTSNGGKLYYSFKTNYKRLMWLDNDELPAGTYQLKIRPFSTRASDGVDIEPYLPMANQLRFAVTNDDGGLPLQATVQRQAYGNPYNVAYFNQHSATVNNSSSHCQVPVDSDGLVARGEDNGQDGFSYDHAVARDGSWQHIQESVAHTFNIVVSETCGIYIYITDGSLAFREEQLSFTKIS